MIVETYSINGQKPNIDKTNNRLNNVVVMSTEFNHNKNATFTRKNQEEIVNLGNSKKVFCYLGHSKRGLRTEDRLIDRLGHFENFRIEGTKVKADLVLSPTIESNPRFSKLFPSGLTDYLFSLAEYEGADCGFSMSVGMCYNEDDSVTIKELDSVDMVEEPALTNAMFSKDKNTIMEDIHPSLNTAFDLFNELDTAIKAGQPTEELQTALLAALTSLKAEEEQENTEAPTEEDKAVEEAPVTAEEGVEVEEEPTTETQAITDIQSQIEELKTAIEDMKAVIMSFSKVEEKEEVKEEPKKKVVFSVISPISHIEEKETKTKEQHLEEFSRLRKSGLYTEAAKYHSQFLG